MAIDSHHHFWHYDPVNYDWIDDEMKDIRRDFLPGSLEKTINDSGIDGVISVQARQSLEETDWLLALAHQHNFIKGIVGWIPLQHKEVAEILEQYAKDKLLKGVRHVIQGEADPDFMLRSDFNKGIGLLKKYHLIYDILVVEKQLPNVLRMVDLHPDQVFVLDHLAKPQIKKNELSPWKEHVQELAKRGNVNCKISGMVTEADYHNWTAEQLHPYFEVVMDAFGPERLLFGSDWPVCLVATNYRDWIDLVKNEISALSPLEQAQIMGGNAERIYKLKTER